MQKQNGDETTLRDFYEGGRRTERVVRECTYQDFMKCKPLYFKGTEGVVELTQWFERMETVFRISNCPVENQVKFSTCTLLAGALTWWNSHVMTVSHDAAYAMTWADLRKKMTDKYCPRNEMKKLEAELWNLKVKGTDVIGYNQLLENKGKFETLPETIKQQKQNNETEPSGMGLMQGLVKRIHTGDLNPYTLNATITTTVRVLQNATNATKLAILLVTVGVREVTTMLTIRGALGQARNLLASSVEFKDTSRGNAQSEEQQKTFGNKVW
ncbi:reverse transcriptase domain-containing protein [Tanacetum coccineum]